MPLSRSGEFHAIDNAREQGLSLDRGALPQQDFAEWFLYCARALRARTYEDGFTILSVASTLAIQAHYETAFTIDQSHALSDDLATAYEYITLDRDTFTASAVLVTAFLNADPR